jgi:DNA-binding response OmpR family regulator/HD-like signal output (HDOD) protein
MIRKEFDELKDSGSLPSPSGVGLTILNITQRDDWAVDDLVGTISADPALTGRIIKLANSVALGSAERISTLNDAALRLGVRAISNQALGFSLVAGNRSGKCEAFDYTRFWSESLARAVAARYVSKETRRSVPAEAFTCALLSRVGELGLASVHASAYSEMLEQHAGDSDLDLMQVESELFAINSREVTMAMVADWGMPASFVDAIEFCDHPDGEEHTSDTRAAELVSILRLAGTIAKFCTGSDDEQVQRWPAMDRVREELDFDARRFMTFCMDLAAEWSEWGAMLEIPTVELPNLGDIESRSERKKALEQRRDASLRSDQSDQFRRLRILAVDDEPVSLKLLEGHLRTAGHHVITARDGKDALGLTLEYNPHIVISDWMMPKMDGIELCKALRRARAGRSVYFLLVTGRGEEDRVVEAFESGIDDYVVKPFNPKILLARVRAGLRLVNMREQVDREQKLQREQTAALGVMARKLRDAASTDLLTGLPNRRYGMLRLDEEWEAWRRDGQPVSLVMLDIDNFKAINDTYGHDVGDLVL